MADKNKYDSIKIARSYGILKRLKLLAVVEDKTMAKLLVELVEEREKKIRS